MSSLFTDCQNYFEKGHESWKSYFSKWETLAKQEENIPESELNEDWIEDLPIKNNNKKKNKKQPLSQRRPTTVSLLTRKRQGERKISRKLKKIKIPQKNKKKLEKKILEQSKTMDNENALEKMVNEQLEMNLRTIFMNILKANKNKWEMFSVLPLTFSQEESTIKGSHPPFKNQHLASTSNDVKLDNISYSFKGQQVFSVPLSIPVNLTNGTIEQNKPRSFWANRSLGTTFKNCIGTFGFGRNQFVDDDDFSMFEIRYKTQKIIGCNSNIKLTPIQTSKLGLSIQSRIIKSCPPSLSNYCYQRNQSLRPLALNFGNKIPAVECNKNTSLECSRKENCGQSHWQDAPDVSRSWEEKSFQSLCSHKKTNGVCLYKENSNFITPERKPSKRKCFSENISQRKRRRSSKLFFDNEDEDSESDDQTERRSLVIRWTDKNQKNFSTSEVVVEESDSDESESILDRIKKP